MKRVVLINPPFTTVRLPSLALAQLRARLLARFSDRLQVEILHLNHDFASFLGVDLYQEIVGNADIYHTGFGDWFFRSFAFPDAPDNTEAYLRRHYRALDGKRTTITKALARREESSAFLDEMIDRYALDRADLVGVTAVFSQTVAGIAIAKKVKRAHPEALTVLGGACCEGAMGRQLARSVPDFDYIFSGGALVSFPDFVAGWLDGAPDARPVRGVISRAKIGARLVTVEDCNADLGADLSLSEPIDVDYDDFLASYYAKIGSTPKPALLFETSRGCWWGELRHCTFCGLNGSTMDHREVPAARAVEQLNMLFDRYPEITFFEAVDNILPHSYLKNVLPFVEPPTGATLFYEVKSNMDEQDAQILLKSHLRAFQPGIESINSDTLKRMRKGVSAFQNIRLLGYCQHYGLVPKWSILIGFPGEPEAVYEKYLADFPLLSHLPPPQDAGPVRFDRFSPYHSSPEEHGLDLHPFDYYRFVFPFDESALRNIAYHFVHRDPQFYVPIARWQRRLMTAVVHWQRRWSGSDGLAPASLYLKGNVVVDTRSGERIEHSLSQFGERMLRALETARTVASLSHSELSMEPDFDAAREVAWLSARGLLFEEEGRFLSLVSQRAPTAPGWDKAPLVDYGLPSYLLTR